MKTIKIGNVEIEKTAALAPMASVADRAYRKICKEFGAAYVVSEMISCKGLWYSDKKTESMCRIDNEERPMALQLFGCEPDFFVKAAEIIKIYKPDIIDVNMGCPVPKVAALIQTTTIGSASPQYIGFAAGKMNETALNLQTNTNAVVRVDDALTFTAFSVSRWGGEAIKFYDGGDAKFTEAAMLADVFKGYTAPTTGGSGSGS